MYLPLPVFALVKKQATAMLNSAGEAGDLRVRARVRDRVSPVARLARIACRV